MASVFDIFLTTHRAVILDGGLATELERRGADISSPLWSAEKLVSRPELISRIHADYLEAGAQIITAAGYQASLNGFAAMGISDGRKYLERSVTLAEEAREEFCAKHPERARPLVAASAGNFGAFRADGSEYRGKYGVTRQAMFDIHARHVEIYAGTGADLMCFETIPSALEAEAICRISEIFPESRFWVSFSTRDSGHISDGTPAGELFAMAAQCENIVAAGFNCLPPERISTVLKTQNSLPSAKNPKITTRMILYPNLGKRWNPVLRLWEGEAADNFEKHATEWAELGATIIGGCCGTTPAHIQRLEQVLRR